VDEPTPGRFRVHDLLAAIILSEIGPERQRHLHGRVGRALAASARPYERFIGLAHHVAARNLSEALTLYDEVRPRLRLVGVASADEDDALIRGLLELLPHDDTVHRANLLEDRGFVLIHYSRYEDGLVAFETALDLFKALGRDREAAWTHYGIGAALKTTGRYAEALEVFEASEVLFRAMNDAGGLGAAIREQGEVMRLVGRLADARERMQVARRLSLQAGDLVGALAAFRTLADLDRLTGRMGQAARRYRSVVRVARHHGLRMIEAYALEGLATIHRLRRELSEGRTLYERVMDLSAKGGDRFGVAVGLTGIATVERLEGEYGVAELAYREAARILRELGQAGFVTWPRLGLIECSRAMGNTAGAQRDADALSRDCDEMGLAIEGAHARFCAAEVRRMLHAVKLGEYDEVLARYRATEIKYSEALSHSQ
jgi:tetratricopeptide (TPR) repeat protein